MAIPTFVALVAILLAFLAEQAMAQSVGSVVVIANPSIGTTSAISRTTLSVIFGMRLRSWEDGTPIRVYVLPDNHPVHIAFSKRILRVFPYQLRVAWDRLVYSGTGQAPVQVSSEAEMRAKVGAAVQPPIEVGSEAEMRAKVAEHWGAIGYLRSEMVDESVSVLHVE